MRTTYVLTSERCHVNENALRNCGGIRSKLKRYNILSKEVFTPRLCGEAGKQYAYLCPKTGSGAAGVEAG
jgi:hypothetical protein